MAQETITIIITENGSRVVKRNLEEVGESASKASEGVAQLKEMLAGIGIGLSIRELAHDMDEYVNSVNRLTAIGTPLNDLSAVYERLFAISQTTHTAMQTTVNLYQRLHAGMQDLGYSENQTLAFTEQLSKAFVTSGATSVELKYAMQDLAHGLAAGTINGRELNGILRETPSVAALMAKALNVTTGELKGLIKTGGITTDALVQGFARIAPIIDDVFGKRITTIHQALTNLGNAWDRAIGQEGVASGVYQKVVAGLVSLGTHMDTIIKIALSVGAAFIPWLVIPAIVTGVASAILYLGAAMMANPVLAFISLMTGAAVALYQFRDSINLGIDATSTLGDLLQTVWDKGRLGASQTASDVANVTDKVKALGIASSTAGEKFQELNSKVEGTKTAFDKIGTMAYAFDLALAAIGTLGAAFKLVVAAALEAGAIVGVAIFSIIQGLVNGIIVLINAAIEGLNKLPGVAITALGKIDVTSAGIKFLDGLDDEAAKAAKEFDKTIGDGLQVGREGGAFYKALQGMKEDIGKTSRERLSKPTPGTALDDQGPRHPPVEEGKKGKKGDELQSLLDKWDHVNKAVDEYNKAINIIAKGVASGRLTEEAGTEFLGFMKDEIKDKAIGNYDAVAKATGKYKIEIHDLKGFLDAGIISQNEFSHAMEVATARSKDAKDPLGAVTRTLEEQAKASHLLGIEKALENKMREESKSLLAKGIILYDGETNKLNETGLALKAKTKLQLEDTAVGNQATAAYDQIVAPLETYKAALKGLDELLNNNVISQQQYDKALADAKYASLKGSTDIGSGIERGFEKFKSSASDLATQSENVFTTAIDGMNNALASFASGGKVNFSQLAQSIMSDIAKMVLKWLELQAVQSLLGPAGAGGGGSGGGSGSGGGGLGGGGGGGIGGLIGAIGKGIGSLGGGAAGAAGPLQGPMESGATLDNSFWSNIGTGIGNAWTSFTTWLGFAGGGSFDVGGSGGTDSQMVAFRASPNERVTVSRPDQDSRTQAAPASSPSNIHIINSIDPKETLAHMSTSDGDRVIVNAIQRNKTAVRTVIG